MTTTLAKVQTEEVACNLCGSTGGALLYRVRDTLYDLPGEFTLRRCRQCDLIYLSPRPTEQSILRYYPERYSSYHRPVEDERFPLMRWMRRRKLKTRRRALERHAGTRPGRILDVGCATGLFLHEMEQAGWQTAGVEPVESAAAFARERFGLHVFNGMLAAAPYPPGTFDVVTFWDVLEHTFAPAEEIGRAARLLRPGGLLAISVPNWASWERRWFGPHWRSRFLAAASCLYHAELFLLYHQPRPLAPRPASGLGAADSPRR
jgi:2-polyprenyl-3-methyl-5-hydroxy-6-metoxy-1,4-benzoquinol methylase